jgi:hypothetical protein
LSATQSLALGKELGGSFRAEFASHIQRQGAVRATSSRTKLPYQKMMFDLGSLAFWVEQHNRTQIEMNDGNTLGMPICAEPTARTSTKSPSSSPTRLQSRMDEERDFPRVIL